ncbi:MAG TPA: hypothetical protein VHB79_33765 [Polyangiaceae bacterium]|nr:hypothetical protein [Polyangiaceae bacterium]
MNRPAFLLSAALALAGAAPALAQTNERVTEAQKAYADVDYAGTRRLAKTAIERGGNDRAATGQLYLLWAMAAAALDQNDEARSAFSAALAVNPELKLDKSVSPKIRGPYLEARGALSTADGKAPLELAMHQHRQELEIELRDALGLATSLTLSIRAREGQPYERRKLAAGHSRRVQVPAENELQAFVQALDGYGNVVSELGSAEDPERLVLVSSERPVSTTIGPERGVNRTPYFVSAGAMAVLGLASGGIATAMYLKREDAAKEWNGASCEQPGMTRMQQCGPVDDRRHDAQTMAIGFGAAGGALLLGSALTLLLTPSSKHEPNVALDAGPQRLMLRLGGEL